jgi:hypothetical protein
MPSLGSVRGSTTWLRALALAVPGFAIALACSSPSHPGYFVDLRTDASVPETIDPGLDAAQDVPPINCNMVETGQLCACTEIGQKPPLLYLLLDRSGSMHEAIGTGGPIKWDAVRTALVGGSKGSFAGVVRKLGKKIRIGVTNFPSNPDVCGAGVEAMSVTQGGPDVYDKLADQLAKVTPGGGTPTAASITKLQPTLVAALADGPVFLLLATDGGPNCRTGTFSCDASTCIPSIERSTFTYADGGVGTCSDTFNCCDPAMFGADAIQNCLDIDATQAVVTALAEKRIKTFVLGVPGADAYGAYLDKLAEAGGTMHYYPTTDASQAGLEAALSAIAAQAIDSCEVTLESAPQDPGLTNVIVDGTIIPQDPVDGWTWGAGNASVELHGKGCEAAKNAAQIQVAVGCKTITP